MISFGNSAFLEHLVLFGFEGQKLGTLLENEHSVLRLDATVKKFFHHKTL